MTETRRVYTEEFKHDAVRLAQERGNLRATAADLGISETVLSRWKSALTQSAANPFPSNGNPKDPDLARLERENARLREENAILNAAVGIFTTNHR